MKKICSVHKNFDTGEYYFRLKDVLAGTNTAPSDVGYYELEVTDDGVILKLYDKNKELIVINEVSK